MVIIIVIHPAFSQQVLGQDTFSGKTHNFPSILAFCLHENATTERKENTEWASREEHCEDAATSV